LTESSSKPLLPKKEKKKEKSKDEVMPIQKSKISHHTGPGFTLYPHKRNEKDIWIAGRSSDHPGAVE
jgi:hypothetical protein